MSLARKLRAQWAMIDAERPWIGLKASVLVRVLALYNARQLGPSLRPTIKTASPDLANPVWLRPHASDLDVLHQVLRDRIYSRPSGSLRTIVDAGANVGYVSAFMLSRNPGAGLRD